MSLQTQLANQLRPFLDDKDLAMVTFMHHSKVDYRNVVYMGMPLKSVWKMQLLHNITADFCPV